MTFTSSEPTSTIECSCPCGAGFYVDAGRGAGPWLERQFNAFLDAHAACRVPLYAPSLATTQETT